MSGIVGELQLLAEQWAAGDEEVEAARRQVSDAETALNAARRRHEAVEKALMQIVGSNVTTRVFKVGGAIVIVEHQHGIRRVAIEDRDR